MNEVKTNNPLKRFLKSTPVFFKYVIGLCAMAAIAGGSIKALPEAGIHISASLDRVAEILISVGIVGGIIAKTTVDWDKEAKKLLETPPADQQ